MMTLSYSIHHKCTDAASRPSRRPQARFSILSNVYS